MFKKSLLFVSVLGLALTFTGTASAQAQNPLPARPGSVNYVEGNATIGPQALTADSAGKVELEKDETLNTQDGKVEILLTPGVFLRVADNSAVKMVSPDLANTEVALVGGRASIEVLDISKNNNIRVDLNDSSIRLENKGLYEFDASQNRVMVYKGKAEVDVGGQKISLGGERQLTLNQGGKL